MQQDVSGGTKKKRVGYLLSGLLALTMPGAMTYLVLGVLHNTQESLPKVQTDAPQNISQPREITASSHRDFGAVCGGFSFKNAAAYTNKSSALIVTFSQSPRTTDSWSYEDVGYGKTYTKTGGDFRKINTVACLHEILDSKVFSKTCNYERNGDNVAVSYYSIRYKLSYYEARTGARIADGGIIEALAGDCPSFVAYDEQSSTAYAAPANEAMDIAHSKFIAQ